jgi:hypothetical protein
MHKYIDAMLHEIVPFSTGSFFCSTVKFMQLANIDICKNLAKTHVTKDIVAHRQLTLNPVVSN